MKSKLWQQGLVSWAEAALPAFKTLRSPLLGWLGGLPELIQAKNLGNILLPLPF